MIRLFLEEDMCSGVKVTLRDTQAHYLKHVMRLKAGDAVDVFNGREGLWRAHIAECGRRVGLVVENLLESQPTYGYRLELLFSPIKKGGLLVEKAVEVGVTELSPLVMQRSVVRAFPKERFQAIVHEACEQSHRLIVPHIHPLVPFARALEHFSGDILLVCSLRHNLPYLAHTLHHALENLKNTGQNTMAPHSHPHPQASAWISPHVGILVGPEGGFSPEEEEALREVCTGKLRYTVLFTSLGDFPLRAETAAAVAVAVSVQTLDCWRKGL